AGFLFGWAKPVPVNFANLRHPKRDMIWVAAAGPGVNLLMAIAWALVLRLLLSAGFQEEFFIEMAKAGVFVNIGLMALNLLPLPPLDGGRILVGLLPHSLALALSRVEPYGFFILIFLLATNTLGFFLKPFYDFPCFQTASFPACAPPVRCTSATITGHSRTGCACRTSIRASSSWPTGMR
ncbi:MAG: site-2 protease family protein, partial [Burkholderiaceae bacterium]|nr:site-2 protease family protein [Burkholderiaceae bacterium]